MSRRRGGTNPSSRCPSPRFTSRTYSGRRDRDNRTETIRRVQQCELTGRVENFIRARRRSATNRSRIRSRRGIPSTIRTSTGHRGRFVHVSVRPIRSWNAYVDSLIEKSLRRRARRATSTPPAHQPRKPAPVGRKAKMGTRARRQPRALRPRPSLRSGRRALSGDRQALAARASRSRARTCSSKTFGPGKRSIMAGSQITEMGLAKLLSRHRRRTLPLARQVHVDERGPSRVKR